MLKRTMLTAERMIGTTMIHKSKWAVAHDLVYLLHVLGVVNGRLWGDFMVAYVNDMFMAQDANESQ
jgi:hypothetical protein